MNVKLKNVALSASVAAVLATGSMSAHAIIQGVPGEAQLIPLFYTDSADPAFGDVDTVIRVTVPRALGSDAVLSLTAPHVAPLAPPAAEQTNRFPALAPGFNRPPATIDGPVNWDNVDLVQFPDSRIHAYFLNSRSEEITNRNYPVTADDVIFIEARDTLPDRSRGYVLLTTYAGSQGFDANFAFFADAWLTVRPPVVEGAPLPYVVNIPTFAMADGADAGALIVSAANNVLETGPAVGVFPVGPEASPIHTGIRTTSAVNPSVRVLDLALAERVTGAEPNLGTLWVWWNDVNENLVGSVEEYDNNENHCSANISLPDELNVKLVPAAGPTPGAAPVAPKAVPPVVLTSRLIDAVNPTLYLCRSAQEDQGLSPNALNANVSDEDLFGNGYAKLYLNQPTAKAGLAQTGAAVAFSIPVQLESEIAVATPPVALVYGSIAANDHGRFVRK